MRKLIKIMRKEGIIFNLILKFTLSGDQPQTIKELVDGIKEDKKHQVLLGAIGTRVKLLPLQM